MLKIEFNPPLEGNPDSDRVSVVPNETVPRTPLGLYIVVIQYLPSNLNVGRFLLVAIMIILQILLILLNTITPESQSLLNHKTASSLVL